jgi:uncharacterized repeat protein (TIGR04052 family)
MPRWVWRRYVVGMKTRPPRLLGLSLLAPLALVGACDDAAPRQDVSLTFRATMGSETFACGQPFTGLGVTGDQTLTVRDARMYVHDVRLVTAEGDEVALELGENAFQHEGIAYLDFADSNDTGCEGNPETRLVVEGSAPEGDYVGVRFTVGMPFEQNHQEASVAASPLNITDMFWAWQSGYKFIKLDGASTGVPTWRFHLGSTGCVGDPMAGGVTSCTAPNRFEVELMGMDLAADSIRFDIAELVSEVNLDTFTPETPPGCMSGAMDPDCTAYFEALGLPHASSPAGVQRVFTVD